MSKRKALLVAIDDYGHPANNLPSCVEDANAFEELLTRQYGFEARRLNDGDATLSKVEEELRGLVDAVGQDDRIVFFFSGHGYQVPKGDSIDEVLVLRENKFLFDDRISELTQNLPPGVLTVVLDCCFAGGFEKMIVFSDHGVEVGKPKRWTPLNKSFLDEEIKNYAGITQYKPFGSIPIKSEFQWDALQSAETLSTTLGMQVKSKDEAGQLQLNGVLLAACQETETASASTSLTKKLSAFTFCLRDVLRQSAKDIDFNSLVKEVDRKIKSLRFKQTPVLKAKTENLGNQPFLLLGNGTVPERKSSIERLLSALYGGGNTAMDSNQDKLVNALLPIVLPALLNRTFPKGYQPGGNGDDKGFGALLPVIAPYIIDRILPKGYQPSVGGGEDKLLGALLPVIAPIILDRVLPKGYQPSANGGEDKLLGALLPVIAPIILDRVLPKGYQPSSDDGEDKLLRTIAPIILDRLLR